MNNLLSHKHRLYLAGPLGFSEVGRAFHKKIVQMVTRIGYEPLDPWTLTPQAQVNSVLAMPYGVRRKRAWAKLNRVFGENNAGAILGCHSMFAVLDGTDVDSGTAAEIGYGSAAGKTIVGYRGDFRLAADNEGSLVNLQVEYFIHDSGGVIVTTFDEAREVLTLLHQKGRVLQLRRRR